MAETAQSPKRLVHRRRAGRSVMSSQLTNVYIHNRQELLGVINYSLVVSGHEVLYK
jgi:hypothetical protein